MGKVVIVGTGQAGFQAAASLRQEGFEGRIVCIGDEPGLPYQRPPLSKAYLKQPLPEARLLLRNEAFFADRRIELRTGEAVTAIERAAARVVLASGETVAYDHLILAVGARNRVLPLPGAEREAVVALRTRAEAMALRDALGRIERLVIVGAGFIGLEVAASARALGIAVTVLEARPRVMGRAVSPAISDFFLGAHGDSGVDVRLSTLCTGVHDNGVATDRGETIAADLVLIAAGVVANTELAEACDLAVDDGIAVDARLLTADPAISAIGDCAAFPLGQGKARLESIQNAVDQAKLVARRLCGDDAPYDAVPWFWSDQGPYKLQIAGITDSADDTVIMGDPASGKFAVYCFRDGAFLGLETVNRPGEHLAARRLLAAGKPLTAEQVRGPNFDLKALLA